MTIQNLSRHALGIYVAVAILAGCGGSQPPIGAPGAMPQSAVQPGVSAQRNAAIGAPRDDGESWMAPSAATQDLLYVSDLDELVVYSYPQGALEGNLRVYAFTLCVDSKGDVYDASGDVYEYKHGGTRRIKTLYPGDAIGCAVDPTTGNLAATDLEGPSGPPGNVAIYTNASGKPKYYSAPGFLNYYFCGYDNKGNLFIDGLSQPGTGHFIFAELPKGARKFKDVTLNQYIGWPGGVQWDGKHVAVGDQIVSKIYRFAISGGQGTLVGTTRLGGATLVPQAWIQGSKIIAPNSISGKPGQIRIYNYPAGGKPVKTIKKGVQSPYGATVSLAPG